MTKEQKALKFVNELAELFAQDIADMKADKEPMGFPGDALNHMVYILEEVGKIVGEEG